MISGSAVINDQAIVSSDVHVGDTARVDFSATARDGVYLAGGAQLTENGKMRVMVTTTAALRLWPGRGAGFAHQYHHSERHDHRYCDFNGHGWIDGGSTIDTGTPMTDRVTTGVRMIRDCLCTTIFQHHTLSRQGYSRR
ncbi:hypothetical protein [Candidatus Reidiella endopervernicosa]|uniref:Uncharacterized protein n=1 Tax=Candidatus Reidiella endopervernicosa TaxID=2738883 RepID=A0A6N0HUB9_9GAMM|nr:hypothetical protein [Candidatus Reidiella endopervernicosa]QKQ25807.1 hypothetical protein HUE57_05570 [Candidatus Reidiella endopervernicosa]